MKHSHQQGQPYVDYLRRYYELLSGLEAEGNRVWPVRRGREENFLKVLQGGAAAEEGRAERLVELLLEGACEAG